MRTVKVTLKNGKVIEVLPSEIDSLKQAGLLKLKDGRPKGQSKAEHKKRIKEALRLKKKNFNNVQIAKELRVSEGTVRKWFKKYEFRIKPIIKND